jgi:hypothetical protein
MAHCLGPVKDHAMVNAGLEQALRVDRPPFALSFATSSFLPATQGQRSKDRGRLFAVPRGALARS